MSAVLIRLTVEQSDEKEKLEAVIRDGVKTFQEVGDALARIYAWNLYADEYESFKEYCLKKWNIGERRAHQLVAAARAQKNIGTTVQFPNERVAREVTSLPPIQQKQVAKVLAQNPGEITAERAKSAVREVLRRPPEPEPAYPLPPPKNHPEMPLNLKPRMSDGERARAYSTISEWFEGNRQNLNRPMLPEIVVKKILALFK